MSNEGDFVPEVAPPSTHQAEVSVMVEHIDSNIFIAPKKRLYKPPFARGVYGGQVIGQALMAAAKTVPPDVPFHSFHCFFILSGSPDKDIVYSVKRLRDGRSFYTRTVNAIQNGKAIFTLTAQFQQPEPSRGLEYHDPMPSVHKPDDLLDIYEYWKAMSKHDGLHAPLRDYIDRVLKRPVTIDQKIVHRAFLRGTDKYREELLPHLWPLMVGDGKPQRFIWMKSHSDLSSSNVNVHKCVIAFMSDMAFIPTALEPLYGVDGNKSKPRIAMTVSLDHSMWFHSPEIRADEWLLFGMYCHVTRGSRALLTCKVWNAKGALVVSVTQEALIRLADDSSTQKSNL
jgi:acyl-CoA thioesterase 8